MSRRPTIALIGMRCAGKSVTGRALAAQLGLPFLDLDLELLGVARRAGERAASAGELLERVGQCRFREYEASALRAVLEPGQEVVLATGGGALERESNRGWLRRSARCIWLRASAQALRTRMLTDETLRPPLLGDDPSLEIEEFLERRSATYAELSELAFDTEGKNPVQLAREIAHTVSGSISPTIEPHSFAGEIEPDTVRHS